MDYKLVGRTLVVTSSQTMEDLKLLERFKPEVLCEKDENGNHVFGIGTGSVPSLTPSGVTFTSKSIEEPHYACLTMTLPETVEDVSSAAECFIGMCGLDALDKIEKIEAALSDAIEEVNEKMANIQKKMKKQ